MWCLGFHPFFQTSQRSSEHHYSSQLVCNTSHGEYAPGPGIADTEDAAEDTERSLGVICRIFLFPICDRSLESMFYVYICIYLLCLYNVNIYIHISWCLYRLYHVITCVNMFPCGQDYFRCDLGWSKNFHVNDLVHTLVSCGYNDPKQMGWVSKISPLDLNHSDLKFPNPGKSIEDVRFISRDTGIQKFHTSILYPL